MNCKQANEQSLHNLLLSMGVVCTKENNKEAWFISPFRNENQASLKVDRLKNLWFDHGAGFGGTAVDFVKKLRNCNVKEALEILRKSSENTLLFSFQKQDTLQSNQTSKLRIKSIKSLQNPALIQYLNFRKISIYEAQKYCEEIYYSFNGIKYYFGIGFRNDTNGFEIRNKYFKGCLINKNITTITRSHKTVVLFESFLDFLSYRSLKLFESEEDYIVLNSTASVQKCLPILQNYFEVKTYFDNDASGKEATKIIRESCKNNFEDCSNLYMGYKDLNDYLNQ